MLCTLICFMVLHSLVIRRLFYTHLTIHLVLKPIHYIQNQSSFIFMVCLSSRNSSNIIRLVNLSIFQVASERLFPILHPVNLDIMCSPNTFYELYLACPCSSIVQQFGICTTQISLVYPTHCNDKAYPSYVKLLQDKIKSVDTLHYGCGYLFINGVQMRNTHATTLKSMTQQIYRTIDIARLYIKYVLGIHG
jgi:hypothetical protein